MSAKSISISISISPFGVLLFVGRHRRTRYSRDLLDRGDAHADLLDAVLLEQAHALLDRDLADRVGRRALDRHLPDLLAHDHRLVDADPALVAGVVAALDRKSTRLNSSHRWSSYAG